MISKKTHLFLFLTILIFFTTSCGPRSLNDFRQEGEGIAEDIVKELKQIHSTEEFPQHSIRLKKLFNKLVDVIIAAHEYKNTYSSANLDVDSSNYTASESLREQFVRIFKMEGGQEKLEKCEQEALNRLDAYEKELKKQRGSVKFSR